MNREAAAMYLESVAACAKALAHDLRGDRTWPGDASRAIAEMIAALTSASREIGDDR